MGRNADTDGRRLSRRGALSLVAGASLAGASLAAASSLAGLSSCAPSGAGEGAQDGVQEADPVGRAIASLSLEQRVCQLFVVRPEDIVDVGTVVAAGEATREALRRRPVGGICYFGRNLEDPDQVRRMLANVESFSEEAVGLPILRAVDEEGGTVARVASNPAFGVANVGDMRSVGAGGDADAAGAAAETVAAYLADLGFNVDFAPVADVAPAGSVMGRRSFGDDPDLVASMVAAQVRGFAGRGVGCCAKHFPGIGYASGDSEVEPISLDGTVDDLAARELVPFAAAVAAGVPMVMVGHLSCAGVTGTDEPASLSSAVVGDLLRGRLGFSGVAITDSLGMGAVTATRTPAEAAVAALEAGQDLILMPADFESALQGVLDAVSSGRIGEGRIEESLRRVVALKLSLAQPVGASG
ncbi:glycoside hydrolase family 3 N-terminal domain-containing protein [Olsenella sp. YH-ols2223]|uniref:beta-N-acetylhexosaminidase n=1 Tax=Olsenella absiana TaxID=3115222 RepID=A0ABU7RBL2_9ACTN